MGERLNLEIYNQGEVIANAYYHWSAYTRSANDLLLQMITVLEDPDASIHRVKDPVMKAIRLLEVTGAGFNEDEMPKVKAIYPNVEFKPSVDRSEGLISISEEGIEQTAGWAEGSAFLDIGLLTAQNNCFSGYDSKEIFMEEQDYDEEEYEDCTFDVIQNTDVDIVFHETDFATFRTFAEFCDSIVDQGKYAALLSDGSIFTMIE